MTEKDLMIGDWVQFSNGSKIKSRINCISPYQHHVAHTDNATWIDNYDEIEPIPLTEEILKLNGFEDANANNGLKFRWYVLYAYQEYGDIWGRTSHEIVVAWREFNSDIFIERPYADTTQRKISVADIRYVHELQHAFRLCGLKELADNFKIE